MKELKKVGEDKIARRAEIAEKGSGAEDAASLKNYVTIWGDLMRDYDESYGAKAIVVKAKSLKVCASSSCSSTWNRAAKK